MLDVTEALMVEQLGGTQMVAAFVERFNALPVVAPSAAPDDEDAEREPSWDTWGTDDDAQERMRAAMTMMGGGPVD